MRFNKTLLAAAAALSIVPAVSLANDFPITVSVEAVVPAADGLQISPVNGWDAITQKMGWDIPAQTLKPIRQQMDMKSNAAIHAYLSTDAKLTSGAEALPMSVSVHGRMLSTGAADKVQLLSDTEAAAGKRVDVVISTTKPTAGYFAGNYSGQVFMMFESTP